MVSWAAQRDIYFTRARPYRKNDQAHVESKNYRVVRRYGFCYRYDTEDERSTLAALWKLVAHRDSINPAELTRDITRLQRILTGLAKSKTEYLIEEAEQARQRRLSKQQEAYMLLCSKCMQWATGHQ